MFLFVSGNLKSCMDDWLHPSSVYFVLGHIRMCFFVPCTGFQYHCRMLELNGIGKLFQNRSGGIVNQFENSLVKILLI